MLVVGLILLFKGALFLFGARFVVRTLLSSHPVTFGHVTRGPNGMRRYVANLRVAGFAMTFAGALVVWLLT